MSATETAARPAPATPPSFIGAALRVFDLSLGQMLSSRRTIFMALVVAAPVVLAVLFRVISAAGGSHMQVGRSPVTGIGVFGVIIWLLYLRFIVPVLGVFYGTSLIADEVEDRTITYLFTRPIPRGSVLLGKYLSYLTCTALVVLPSVMIVYFLLGVGGAGWFAASFPILLKDLGLLAVGLAVYGALFACAGAQLKRPLVTGLIFAFGWEQIAMMGYLKKFTVVYYLQALVPHAMPRDSVLSLLQSVFRDVPSATTSLVSLAVIWALFLFLAVRTVERREYVLEQ